MPRLGSESNSSVRRHNPTQTLSNYFQVNSQVWQIRTSGPPTRAEASTSQPPLEPDAQFDVLDDLLSRTRASGRTRWNARTFGSPYGPRPLHKWLPSEQKHFEEMSALMEMFPEPGSDDEIEEEPELHELVAREQAAGDEADEEEIDEDEADGEDGDEDEVDEDEESESDLEEADTGQSPQPHSQPQSSAAAKKREKNKRKRAKARAKAKDKDKMKPPSTPDPARDPPQDLLVSMSRIAQLVGSLNTDSPDESNELLQRVRDAFTEEGRRQLGSLQPTEPAQWRAEVLQSVRRMESMLGQMEKWQAQVAPGEIEALRAETARLEVRVRAVVEQKERERGEVHTSVQTKQARDTRSIGGPSEAKNAVDVGVEELGASSEGEEPVELDVDGDGLFQAGAEEKDGDDVESLSDSAPESNSTPSESDTGPTEPDPDDHLLPEDKNLLSSPPLSPAPPPVTLPSTTATPEPPPQPVHPPLNIVIQPAYNIPAEALSPPSPITSALPPSSPQSEPPSAIVISGPAPLNTLGAKNQNIPPEPPANPVEYLTKHPWTMIEVLFLLEVVAHFPPAEHGWTFIAEAYNNILITRPLQEWFGKQATASNEEETKMKNVLQKMHTEARQLRARRAQEAAAQSAGAGTGERGKAAPFGSAEAQAEANARAKQPATAGAGALDKDALIVTRLPALFPPPAGGVAHAADNPAAPPPAQRVVTFPRRRPPLSLLSEDAKSFARVMASAVAGVRPPSAESRAAMLALYSATKARFPVRTPWDCWHRWCTPWVVQDPGPSTPFPPPPIVLDYIAGNICLPAGTWITQAQDFVYRPVPGTYPEVPGVQRKVTAGYDPRLGMVAFARTTHLLAERTWAGMGLKRRPDGTVTEEILVGRRAKLPGTLAGIWPGRSPGKAGANARPAAQSSAQPAAAQPAAAQSAAAQPPPNQATSTEPPSSTSTLDASGKKVRFAPLPAKPPKAAPAASMSTASNTTTNPRPPFLPLPTPRPRPPTAPPHVPEGTFGHPSHPGMAAWFERAAVRADVLERVLDLEHEREKFERAVGGCAGDALERKSREEEGGGRGRRVPLHLRTLNIPPPPAHVSGQPWLQFPSAASLVS
ncbi:hypothetical protein TRAPUB_14314 [Trametes pubescens]|uniref:Uncharacterized protein n=1 Tax=Trametes pubescens TaxID=154538 RepID=A0A1M2VNQ7_TRAPU|nr:hypothetical protein TRAPUB_14314 [Trametes pubescens]